MYILIDVSMRYGNEYALDSISLKIDKGMNFITGASGSGKSTLLKILGGFIEDYDGEVTYENENLKDLSKKNQAYLFNSEFGFVWQEFNLIENATVLENILLPCYLKDKKDIKYANKLMAQLKISSLEKQKVKTLSGGQKQRVAIAREMMKKPSVILADEPTSALDAESTKNIMDVLRSLSKTNTVIVVTHDTSLIKKSDQVYELDKGILMSSPTIENKTKRTFNITDQIKLGIGSAFKLACDMIKNTVAKSFVSVLTLIVASTLLLTTISGSITISSQSEFDKLFDTYGDTLLDLSLVSSFMSASGTDGKDDDKPNGDVNQSLDGLYDKYKEDPRVTHISFLQAFEDINIKVDGRSYQITSSGTSPAMKELLDGSMPQAGEQQVVVPKSFIKSLGLSNKEAIGKTIDFSASIYQWVNDTPIPKPVSLKATIVGVADTSMTSEYEGQKFDYELEDSFFFNKEAIDEARRQAGIKDSSMNFVIRAKTPSDLISLKNELNKNGIIPIGYFELIEDLVDLNTQTTDQSSSVSVMIAVLSIATVIAISIMSSLSRRKEFAIYRICGYSNKQLRMISIFESILIGLVGVLVFLITSPLWNTLTVQLFSTTILNMNSLLLGSCFVIGLSVLMWICQCITLPQNIIDILKKGDTK